MAGVLIVGATRGLGASLATSYVKSGSKVYGTARSSPKDGPDGVQWITGVDLATEKAGSIIVKGLEGTKLNTVFITAGLFETESFDEPSFENQVKMYTISSIGPVFVVHHLVKAGALEKGSKVILVSSEAGSITLRHESEGGGNFGHHGSKAALNMVGKLLSFDLKDKGVAVGMVHPGFMRTEMTRRIGFDKAWDEGGETDLASAVTPDVAAKSLEEFVSGFDISQTGEYWAPRGPGDIGTAEPVLGPKDTLSTPLKLPW